MAATADSVLVADRGVAAVRVIAALQRRGTKAVSVHTEADAGAVHATLADESVLLGPTTASYGDVRKLIEAARQAGAQGVHPAGADVPGLAQAVADAGLTWCGGRVDVPVALLGAPPVVEAVAADQPLRLSGLPPRAVEVVTGLDVTGAGPGGAASGAARAGVALSVDVVASLLAPVTVWRPPAGEDLWVDAAVAEGTSPADPLLAVLTVWGPDRGSAYARAGQAWDRFVIEGPVVDRPAALGRGPQ
ncbi:MAG: biotin/lipoyl-binding protein [Frankiales bacterium]|jgi:acetyl/propionyl-CoA carboxylase alpha subunit|nr:biotin/lipoyl-binding protein [Frankiales bacterium]